MKNQAIESRIQQVPRVEPEFLAIEVKKDSGVSTTFEKLDRVLDEFAKRLCALEAVGNSSLTQVELVRRRHKTATEVGFELPVLLTPDQKAELITRFPELTSKTVDQMNLIAASDEVLRLRARLYEQTFKGEPQVTPQVVRQYLLDTAACEANAFIRAILKQTAYHVCPVEKE